MTSAAPAVSLSGHSLHRLEQMKVLRPRFPFNIVREFRNKEWWYTGIYDPQTGVYISWYFIRVNAADKLTLTIFDPELDDARLPRVNGFCRLHPRQIGDGLCLRARGKTFQVTYRLLATGQWRFCLHSDAIRANILISQTIPAFTKFDNELEDYYAIIHYFHNRANGTVRVAGGRSYPLSNALVYQDHCYGRVPTRTGWHWIAVQSERIALTVLVNHGAYAQRFAQVWLTPGAADTGPRTGQWIRLEQDVSFEREDRDSLRGTWRVTSPDLDLTVEPKQLVTDRTKILPFVGLFVNLAHTEMFVKATGQVRVDGRWVDTGPMHGVMEQHHGRW